MRKGEWYFYRVEDKDGQGPYWFGAKGWEDGKHCVPTHPAIADEIGLEGYIILREQLNVAGFKTSDCFFGFITLRQLQRWFSPLELKRLEKLGYRIKRVLGKSVLDVPSQSMFIPERR